MKPTRILLIDDEEDYCLLMKSFFFARNCDVQIAHTLKEGLDFIEIYNPEILFLDNNLPDGHGWDKTNWLKEELPMVEIILMSAFKTLPKKFDHSKRVHVLEKPVSFSTLDTTLQLMP